MKILLSLCLIWLGALAPLEAQEASFHEQFLNGAKLELIKAGGTKADSAQLAQKKYLFIYFSAHWCPPCRVFTPKLVEFYNKQYATGDFELLFVSSDEDQGSMNDYMAETHMPWLGLKLRNKNTEKLKKKYGVRGIPCLVLLNEKDEVLASSYDGEKYLGPSTALKKYATLHTPARPPRSSGPRKPIPPDKTDSSPPKS